MGKSIFDLAKNNTSPRNNIQDGTDETLRQTENVIESLILPPATNISSEKQGLQELNIADLVPFPNQPFKPYKEEQLQELAESIKENGVIIPIVVRPIDNNMYEIIAGRNRVNGAKLAGLSTVPSIVKHLDDLKATIEMVETNLKQRTKLLPSEIAFAIKMRMEAQKRQEKSTDFLNPNADEQTLEGQQSQIETLTSKDVANEQELSRANMFRFIRLTYLLTNLLDTVDNNELPLNAGVIISYLNGKEQSEVYEYFFIDNKDCKLDLKMAEKIRELSKKMEVTYKAIDKLVNGKPVKPKKLTTVTIKYTKIKDYFPDTATAQQIEKAIIEALEFFNANKTNNE